MSSWLRSHINFAAKGRIRRIVAQYSLLEHHILVINTWHLSSFIVITLSIGHIALVKAICCMSRCTRHSRLGSLWPTMRFSCEWFNVLLAVQNHVLADVGFGNRCVSGVFRISSFKSKFTVVDLSVNDGGVLTICLEHLVIHLLQIDFFSRNFLQT